ncbi:ABC transporter permease [Solwaraspora sp. WMMD791]|uniref:ABC transporter permease n=1 Tax=Solwaraspora sp. WMMD791 TaxID=3016086 RepID=UPI00249A3C1A|nr:ABC transporter permease [Solwaraspora sp. WMMD791]WFE28575.1 ABC transporter permease [Solwaraspora sp. WMMD791]
MLRATLKSLLSRKLRLVLSGVAIILGVLFVSSATVLTDSLSDRFERLFQTVNADVAVQVQAADPASQQAQPPLLTEADLDRLAAVPGVASVTGDASATGVIPFRAADDKAVPSQAPQLGIGLADTGDDDALLQVAQGRAPAADDEVALTRLTADQAGVTVGDRLRVYVSSTYETSEYEVVGLLEYSGGRATLGGETLVAFTVAHAQQLFYGETGVFGAAQLTADDGIADDELKRLVAAEVPAGFEAVTGAEVADEQASQFTQLLTFVNWFFLGFALIALLVGMFLIFNTFNILVAQRSRELALLRALGASWTQVTSTVLIEALVVGLIASTLGLAAGVGVAAGLQYVAVSALSLPAGGLIVSPTAVLASYLVGVLMTVVAALVPAVRASSVPPIAAMRDVVRPDRSLTGLTVTGAVVTAVGAVGLALGLAGVPGVTVIALGGGVLLSMIGVALLSPALTRPIAGTVGRLVSWGTASGLGRRNTLRNPRRTAVTAAALMIGVTLVSTIAVIGASLKATTTDLVENGLGAEIIILTNGQQLPTGREGFDPQRLDEVAALDGVTGTLAYHFVLLTADGRPNQIISATDLSQAGSMFAFEIEQGRLDAADDEAVVDTNTAQTNGWALGDEVVVDMPRGGERSYEIVGIYRTALTAGLILPQSQVQYFAGPLAYQGFVATAPDADVARIVTQTEELMADYPLVTVGDRSSFVQQQNQLVDILLSIFYVLLALAVLVAFIGIINTLVLSIYERTRELGLLRAVGMSRRQVRRMVRVESLLMAVFGCLLGVGLGVALGLSASYAMRSQDVLSVVSVPYGQLAGFVVAAALAGVVAAWWPAWRASRLNVLQAIAYE